MIYAIVLRHILLLCVRRFNPVEGGATAIHISSRWNGQRAAAFQKKREVTNAAYAMPEVGHATIMVPICVHAALRKLSRFTEQQWTGRLGRRGRASHRRWNL